MNNLAMGVAAIILAGHGAFDLSLEAEMSETSLDASHIRSVGSTNHDATSLLANATTDAISLEVLAHGITFASDLQDTGTHRYPVARDTSNRGFINGMSPISAIEIVLLENLHPRFADLMVGSTYTDRDQMHFLMWESTGLNGDWIELSDLTTSADLQAAVNALGTIDGSFLSAGARGGESDSDVPYFTSDLFDSANTTDGGNFGWRSSSDQSGSWSGGVITDSGSGNNNLAVVPLPLPVTLTGCGLITALLVRRRMRN